MRHARRTVLAALLGLASAACGERGAPPPGPGRFSGRFATPTPAGRLELLLEEVGNEVRVTSAGVTSVGRRLSPSRAAGRMRTEEGESEFELELKQGRLAVRFTVIGEGGERTPLPETLLERLPDDFDAPARDEALVGHWVDRVEPGGGAEAPPTHFEMLADGTYRLWLERPGQEAAAAPRTTGRWKTEQGLLWRLSDAETRWRALGRYRLEEGRLVLDRDVGDPIRWVRLP